MAAKKKAKKVAASKKKASKATIRRSRSQAAKKGWDTRRKKLAVAQARKLQNAQKGLPKAKRKAIQVPKKEDLDKLSRDELIAKVLEQAETIAEQEADPEWVDAMPEEYLNRDKNVALYPSRARHMGVETDYIIERLKEVEGTLEFDDMCYDLADEYDMPVQEIYTVFFSP